MSEKLPSEWNPEYKEETAIDSEKITEVRGTDYLTSTKEITVGSGTTSLRVNQQGLFLGSEQFSTAPFSVSMAGVVIASSLTLSGGSISYGKTSFTDSANAGYWIDQNGIYFGSASDVTKLKFTVSSGTLDLVGSKYRTHLEDNTGIKIYTGAPSSISGNTGPFLPTDNAEPASPYNGVMWTNPANAQSISGGSATASQGTATRYTIWKTFTNLNTVIPDDATITGISVRCNASVDTVAQIAEPTLTIQLTKNGVDVVGTDRSSGTLTVTDAMVVAGDSDDLWGTTWAKSDFGSSFGVMISGTGTSTPYTTFRIDYIQTIVHYTRTFTTAFGETIAEGFMELWNGVGENTLLYLKRNTATLYIDKANLNVLGSLTVEPPEIITGNTGGELPTDNAEPTDILYSDYPWTDPENAYTADASYATASQGTTKYTIWKGFDLLDSIPGGAIITGVKVECYAKVDTVAQIPLPTLTVQLSKDGFTVVGSTDETGILTTDVALVSAGSSGALWGTTWTKGDFGLDFGVMISGSGSSGPATEYQIDYIKATVYYTTTTNSSVSSNILPGADDTYDLGSGSVRYSTIYTRDIESSSLQTSLDNVLNSYTIYTSPTRVIGTVYYNTSGKTMIALITVSLNQTASASSYARVIAKVGGSEVGRIEIKDFDVAGTAIMMLTMVVPDGSAYQLVEEIGVGSTTSIVKWTEVTN